MLGGKGSKGRNFHGTVGCCRIFPVLLLLLVLLFYGVIVRFASIFGIRTPDAVLRMEMSVSTRPSENLVSRLLRGMRLRFLEMRNISRDLGLRIRDASIDG